MKETITAATLAKKKEEFVLNDFITDKWDSYGKSQYRAYKKLSASDKSKIVQLKDLEGQTVMFKTRGKILPMQLVCVILQPGEVHAEPSFLDENGAQVYNKYSSYPYEFRLNYVDGKDREWPGFWTRKIENVIIP